MAGLLSHVRVLDLSRVFAGPWACQMLADFGAEVIKVEHPAGGDDVRRMGLPQHDAEGRETGETTAYLGMNRGKRSIAVDIAKPEGSALARRLAASSDVVVENFKTGGLARYGLDYASLKAVNPKLVYCSITGYGQTGPKAALPGYDAVFQAMSGLMSMTGVADGQPGSGPVLTGYSISDINAGLYATIAILAALNHRDQPDGTGQHIDLALPDAQIHAMTHVAMSLLVGGRLPGRAGAMSQATCPWQAFEASDRPIMLAVGTDAQFRRLVELIGLPDLGSDPRFKTNRDRMANRDALIPGLAAVFATQSAQHWTDLLGGEGLAVGPINSLEQALADPQVQARGLVRTLPHPLAGEMATLANPIVFSNTPVALGRHPPLLGEHTAEVLAERLGLTAAEIEALAAAGVVRLGA